MKSFFIGTFKCSSCSRRVRIYDWLPECILCASCNAKIQKAEDKAEDRDLKHQTSDNL